MGYTHYWYQKQDCPPDTWSLLALKARQVLASKTSLLCFDDVTDNPQTGFLVTDSEIMFNGRGDDSYETFWLERIQEPFEHQLYDRDKGTFNCCKTARKPYDVAVCAVLLLADQLAPEVYTLKTDGDLLNWLPAIGLVTHTLNEPPYIPRMLRDQLLPTMLTEDLTHAERAVLRALLESQQA